MLLLAGCAPAADVPAHLEPRLVAVDSVALADTGQLALGDLAHAGLYVADDAFWVGDRQNGRVVRFARDGRALGQVGRKGAGPGELGGTGPLVRLADGSVAVWDYMQGKLVAFDPADGSLRWETPVREQAFPVQLQAVGDTLWFGVVSIRDGTGAMRLPVRGSQPVTLAPAPAEYAAGLAYSFPYSVALRFGDTLLVGYAGHHRVFLHHDGGAIDSLVVPVRHRRGVPPDLLQQAKGGLAARDPDRGLENYVSTLSRAERLPDGAVALVHYDVDFAQGGEAPATATAWLTVLDPSFQRACVDAALPLAEGLLPSLAVRGDTLFALEHVLTDTRSTPVIRAYTISTAGCAWVPVERG